MYDFSHLNARVTTNQGTSLCINHQGICLKATEQFQLSFSKITKLAHNRSLKFQKRMKCLESRLFIKTCTAVFVSKKQNKTSSIKFINSQRLQTQLSSQNPRNYKGQNPEEGYPPGESHDPQQLDEHQILPLTGF